MDSDEHARQPKTTFLEKQISLWVPIGLLFAIAAGLFIWTDSMRSRDNSIRESQPSGSTFVGIEATNPITPPTNAAQTQRSAINSPSPPAQTKQMPGESSTENGQASSRESTEYKLASNNSGGLVSRDDPSVAKFRALLDRIKRKSSASESQVADALVEGHKILSENGHTESLLGVTEHVAEVTDSMTYDQLKFSDVVASYVVLRGKGSD